MPRLRKRPGPQQVADQMLARDLKMLEKAKLLGSQRPKDFMVNTAAPGEQPVMVPGTDDDWLALCARTKQSETPFFLRDAAGLRDLALKREEAAESKPTVLIVVSEAPKSVEEWQTQAHAIQAQHEAERVKELLAAQDADFEPKS